MSKTTPAVALAAPDSAATEPQGDTDGAAIAQSDIDGAPQLVTQPMPADDAPPFSGGTYHRAV